jgi:Raf kinase inhibitor-like YbhB/YbcL family protein
MMRKRIMKLESTAFENNKSIPTKYTCEGRNISPPLNWTGAPKDTKSFVLFMEDPDASGSGFKHWCAYDIPAKMTTLKEGVSGETTQFRQTKNDAGDPGYAPPCPPKGESTHHYKFSVWALDVDQLDVSKNASYDRVREEAKGHKLAGARLTGLFERSK